MNYWKKEFTPHYFRKGKTKKHQKKKNKRETFIISTECMASP